MVILIFITMGKNLKIEILFYTAFIGYESKSTLQLNQYNKPWIFSLLFENYFYPIVDI